ncbi:MAG TPA: NAD(P)/FAD-dependent oxidoreductase [Chitinispirillaceae bacterium]|nr:NAD(P)/FAD-dependent oxidoreductase [Chitinispirillaceae bacterium]
MNQPVHDKYDIVIVGAGPAGLSAGLHVVPQKDISVLLLDKTMPWKKPMPCAEGVGKLGFEEAVPVKKEWIRQEIKKACFHAPDNETINYVDNNGGYIIDRSLMQSDIASQLSENGIECLFNTKVLDISAPEEKSSCRTITLSNQKKIQARVIIDASGPTNCFCKAEKITWKPEDLEPALFVHVEDIEIEPDTIHIYAGTHIAPGGYAWVFPRGTNAANIGIVIGRKSLGTSSLPDLLSNFLSTRFPAVKIVHRFAGPIPCSFKKGPIALPGILKTGDAASTINPISRAGISEALLCGGLAGDHALRMLRTSNPRELKKICKSYETEWNIRRGNRHNKLSRVKNALLSVPDEDYNKGAAMLSSIPLEKMTMRKIFQASLGRFPRLVWALRHLM